ncbi:MAG: hypothetical protein E3K37_13710 [Candidatus Kuenenia sp.]|nr:hypothetical protein [Candidatus Kuenenia hertensis]
MEGKIEKTKSDLEGKIENLRLDLIGKIGTAKIEMLTNGFLVSGLHSWAL